MLERDKTPGSEGSGAMLFQLLKSLLMILPQSTCYVILKDRLTSISRFRQSTLALDGSTPYYSLPDRSDDEVFVQRVEDVRRLHCSATWQTIRADSLEVMRPEQELKIGVGSDRRAWLGYASKEEESIAQQTYRENKKHRQSRSLSIEEISHEYQDLGTLSEEESKETEDSLAVPVSTRPSDEALDESKEDMSEEQWREYWANADP